jgi:transcriptional repressor NrdR
MDKIRFSMMPPVVGMRPAHRRRASERRQPATASTASTVPRSAHGTVGTVRCPRCSNLDDKVVDSRLADEGAAIRRRRECLACGRRFTTFERLDDVPLLVHKRSGAQEPFSRTKVVAGMRAAAKNRPVTVDELEAVATEIEEALRLEGGELSSERIGQEVLARLRALDEVAYLRFASVYKGFEGADDFRREAGLLQHPTGPGEAAGD